MDLIHFKEYTYDQIILRLFMEEIKECYESMESISWSHIKGNLSRYCDDKILPLISEYIRNSDFDSLSTYDDLTPRILRFSQSKKGLLDTIYRIFDEFFADREIKNTAQYNETRDKISGKFHLVRDKYFIELDQLLDRKKEVTLNELAKYGNNRDGLYPLLITLSYIANELWYISVNIGCALKNKLIDGEVVAHGIDTKTQNIDMKIIKKELWKHLEFTSPESASFNQYNFSNLEFTIKKPEKTLASNRTIILSLIKKDYPNEEYQGLKPIDLDELALKYQKILQKTPFYDPYKDTASIRKIIAEKFSELDKSYEKPRAGRPKKTRQSEPA